VTRRRPCQPWQQPAFAQGDDPGAGSLCREFQGYVRKFGKVPDSIFQDNPPTTLERLALSMIREAIAQGKEEKASPGGRGFPP
jgi:hypothetical protein